MAEVTQLLSQIDSGNSRASEELLPLVYAELRKLAASRMAEERVDLTLQATALVHEAYLRLVGGQQPQQWSGRGHFFSAAAESMRRILVEAARRKNRLKRGGEFQKHDLQEVEISMAGPTLDVLALDEALKKLQERKPQVAKLVELRYFAGLTVDEAAEFLEISRNTADRHWTYARTWLYRELSPDSQP